MIDLLRKAQLNLQTSLNTNIFFDGRVDTEQKLDALNRLNNFIKKSSNKTSLPIFENNSIKIGTYYSVNENGSVQIPWNFS